MEGEAQPKSRRGGVNGDSVNDDLKVPSFDTAIICVGMFALPDTQWLKSSFFGTVVICSPYHDDAINTSVQCIDVYIEECIWCNTFGLF